jgi:hypothetical protein
MAEPSTAPWDQPRKASTVTVRVPNPFDATDAELLAALDAAHGPPPLVEPRVEYVNFRNSDGRVCFGVSWRNLSAGATRSSDRDSSRPPA